MPEYYVVSRYEPGSPGSVITRDFAVYSRKESAEEAVLTARKTVPRDDFRGFATNRFHVRTVAVRPDDLPLDDDRWMEKA